MKGKFFKRVVSFFLVFAIFISINTMNVEAAGGYSIVINVTQNVITIYQNGTPVKAMVCSTGSGTPRSGTYRTMNKYVWHSLMHGYCGQYCTRIMGQVLFHSVPSWTLGDKASVDISEYNKLGTAASAGCIRLCVADAKWIYDNCPLGTPVTFVTDSSLPLGKPTAYKIYDVPERFSGWDPTDPDSSNPYSVVLSKDIFDADFYTNKYSDIKAVYGNDEKMLAMHWVSSGMDEGRQTSAAFDINYYMNAYGDLKQAFGNDKFAYMNHYVTYGKAEGRQASKAGAYSSTASNTASAPTVYDGIDYSPIYNYEYYINNNGDIKAAYGNDSNAALAHFVTYGMREGRKASANFDVYAYRNNYPDLRAAYGNNIYDYYIHYLRYGRNEGRTAIGNGSSNASSYITESTKPSSVYNGVDYSAVYDYDYYVGHNQDVKAAFGNDTQAVLQHFVTDGMNEGRRAKADFDVHAYKQRYGDLQAEYGDNLKSYYLHYINYGIKEGRSAN